MSAFDLNTFMDASTTEASTRRPPLPAGTEIMALIKDLKVKPWTKKDDPTKSGVMFDVTFELDLTQNPDLHKLVGVDKVLINDGIMLDVTENGAIDYAPGKNNKLRRYREALDMNKPGEPFAPRNMMGRYVKVKTKQEPYEGELYDKIDSVVKAS